jgi:hypothetical protein
MGTPIQGVVEIQTDPGGVTRIVLDPDTADITAGGGGASGNLVLKNAAGETRTVLGHILRIKASDGTQLLELTTGAGLFVGGESQAGELILSDGANHQTVYISGLGRSLRMGTASSPRFRLESGIAWLGGNGSEGRMLLFPGNGDNETSAQATIGINGTAGDMRLGGNGTDGDIRLQGPDGKDRIRLDGGGGNLWLGGNGRDGDLVMFKASGDNQSLEDASIHLNGSAGDIILRNADCAEEFDVAPGGAEPGTVMVLDDEGRLVPASCAYDKRVAGVVSGAGAYRPGIVLDRQPRPGPRVAIALIGKAYCKVDAGYGAVETGDLLTTSATRGHAMKAAEPARAFGSVIGKALRPLPSGAGLIPVLIALQ